MTLGNGGVSAQQKDPVPKSVMDQQVQQFLNIFSAIHRIVLDNPQIRSQQCMESFSVMHGIVLSNPQNRSQQSTESFSTIHRIVLSNAWNRSQQSTESFSAIHRIVLENLFEDTGREKHHRGSLVKKIYFHHFL